MRSILVPILLAIAAPAPALHAASADKLSYVFMSGKDGTSMMSGSSEDFAFAKRFGTGDTPFLYVRDDGVGYLIRDAALLRRVESIMKPQQDLGARQGALGEQQGELGKRQGALGAEQGRLGARMADATPATMSALGKAQAALGRRQAELGKQQAALGARQAELGAEQARLAELAQPQLRTLVADAIRLGLAQKVD